MFLMNFKTIISIALLHFALLCKSQHWNVSTLANLPTKLSNNAVCEAFVGDTAYVYTFAGIDSSKLFSGTHLKSYRYNTINNQWTALPNLPDTLGKIACSANRVKDTIYIIGGYHVFSNSNELSSNKVHRFNVKTNQFMTDGANIPIAIDDQTQCVYKDSLIFVITGWSNTSNVPNVQIYNPSFNTWLAGTSTPNNNTYKSFGSSGSIVGDTIYYLGGATSASGFGAQTVLRKGYINPLNPTLITWQFVNPNIKSYRSACVAINQDIYWLGGSEITYNYNGIAYNGSGGVSPSNKSRKFNSTWDIDISNTLPMDLRGYAKINDSTVILVGGMKAGQMVTNEVLKLQLNSTITSITENSSDNVPIIYPNPFNNEIKINLKEKNSCICF